MFCRCTAPQSRSQGTWQTMCEHRSFVRKKKKLHHREVGHPAPSLSRESSVGRRVFLTINERLDEEGCYYNMAPHTSSHLPVDGKGWWRDRGLEEPVFRRCQKHSFSCCFETNVRKKILRHLLRIYTVFQCLVPFEDEDKCPFMWRGGMFMALGKNYTAHQKSIKKKTIKRNSLQSQGLKGFC